MRPGLSDEEAINRLQSGDLGPDERALLVQRWRPLTPEFQKEILKVLELRVQELSQLKDQQWRYTYLTLTLDGALVVSAHSHEFQAVLHYGWLTVAAAIVAAVSCFLALRDLQDSLSNARGAMQTCYWLMSDPANATRVGLGRKLGHRRLAVILPLMPSLVVLGAAFVFVANWNF